nr:hypothetical protein [Tanacetum cinerariifolium]
MTSITAQQTMLDLELVPKENRLDVRKCNRRIPRGLKPKEETFQVVLDALALTPCYLAFVITADVPEESKAYKTYLAYAIGTVPPKVARKFKKASTSIKDSVPVSADEEHVQKGKRVKRSAKKSSTTPTTCIIREPPVETQTKRKEKMKEVRKKSLRDFHKSHPSGSESWGNDKDESNNEEDSESNQQDDDDEDKDDDDDDEDDDNDDDKSECDEDKGIDSDDVQDKKADVRMTDAQQEKENLETTQEQVVEDAHVKITKKTKVPVTSSSRSSDLVSKFLKF